MLCKCVFELVENKNNTLKFYNATQNITAYIFILEEDIFRVMFVKNNQLETPSTWSIAVDGADIDFKGRDRFSLEGFSKPVYTVKQDGTIYEVISKTLKVLINLENFVLNWFYLGDTEVNFLNDVKTINYNFGLNEQGIYHYTVKDKDDMYFGLGEKTGEVNKDLGRYRIENLDSMGYNAIYTDPLYKSFPFYITYNKKTKNSFGIFYDNAAQAVVDLGKEIDNYHGRYKYYQSNRGDLDYYVIAGPKVRDVAKKFVWLSGRNMFMPKWSLAYSGSTMSYTDSEDAQQKMQLFLDNLNKYDFACESFHLSSGYTSINGKRYVFNWNYSKFPDPKQFIASYRDAGIYLCTNIKPFFLIDHPLYQEAKDKGLFILDKDKKQPQIVYLWDNLGSYLDFTNPQTIEFWQHNVQKQLLEFGIASLWNDNNEFEVRNNNAKCHNFSVGCDIANVRPIQTLLMIKASKDIQQKYNPKFRVYNVTRSGFVGLQRYAQTWTGDNFTSWDTLKYNIKMGHGLTLSGVHNFGHDIGGFAGNVPDKELFVRWLQNGIFYPRFTVHSWNDDQTVNELWMYEDLIPIIKQALQLRHNLIPYLYTLLYKSHTQDEGIIVPTFYYFQNDEQTFLANDDFMLGDSLLVANVVHSQQKIREVYLPKHNNDNVGWYNFYTNEYHKGGTILQLSVELDSIPLFAKEGSIIPLDISKYGRVKAKEQRAFKIFPLQTNGTVEYTLYEDDGISNNYLQGEYKKIKISAKFSTKDIHVDIQEEGAYQLPYNTLVISFPSKESRSITTVVANNNITVEVIKQ